MDEHRINQAYEEHLDRLWEDYNEENPNEDDYDDRAYDMWVDEGCQYAISH